MQLVRPGKQPVPLDPFPVIRQNVATVLAGDFSFSVVLPGAIDQCSGADAFKGCTTLDELGRGAVGVPSEIRTLPEASNGVRADAGTSPLNAGDNASSIRTMGEVFVTLPEASMRAHALAACSGAVGVLASAQHGCLATGLLAVYRLDAMQDGRRHSSQATAKTSDIRN